MIDSKEENDMIRFDSTRIAWTPPWKMGGIRGREVNYNEAAGNDTA